MTEGVVRVGRTVRRPVRPHTPAVHALLRHLEAVGFEGAPRVLGIDAQNREVLSYLPGQVPHRPLPGYALSDATLVALAELQLRYHEAVTGFEAPSGARWDGELTWLVDGPVELICHCDINLENVIFRPGPGGPQPYALIDFDLARPGTRLVDIIQTLRYWAPLAAPADRDPAFAAWTCRPGSRCSARPTGCPTPSGPGWSRWRCAGCAGPGPRSRNGPSAAAGPGPGCSTPGWGSGWYGRPTGWNGAAPRSRPACAAGASDRGPWRGASEPQGQPSRGTPSPTRPSPRVGT